MNVTVIPIVIGVLGTIPKSFVKENGWLRNQRTSGDHLEYCIIKIGQNTEKSPGDLRRLTVTQTLVKNYQLTPVWKNSKRKIIIMIIIIIERSPKVWEKTGGIGNKKKNRDHPDCSIDSKNTKKNPGNLKRPVFTQTPMKDQKLTLAWKASME